LIKPVKKEGKKMAKQPFPRDLWKTREEALAALEGSLLQEAEILQEAFALMDECITQLLTRDTKYTRVCAITMIKARNLELGCYSLALDGLAQEGGALFRLVVETLELLNYFWKDPSRVDEAIEGKLPPAGKIAQKIEGNFKGLRDFLNSHASHFSFTYESLQHIADPQNLNWKVIQPHNDNVLQQNLRFVFLTLVSILKTGAYCLSMEEPLESVFADAIDNLQAKGFRVFNLGMDLVQ
jgi:hypothetical protein